MTPEQQLVQAVVNLITAIVTLAVPAVIAFIAPRLAEAWRNFKDSNPDIAYQLEQAAKFGADYAEKLDIEGQIENYAKNKKGAAMDAAKEWLRVQGFSETDLSELSEALDKAIEVILFRDQDDYPPVEKSVE